MTSEQERIDAASHAPACPAVVGGFPCNRNLGHRGDHATGPDWLVSAVTGTFTAAQFGEVVLGAVDMLEQELGLGERDHDLLSLLVAAVGVRLSVPDAGLDAVIGRALPDRTPAEVRRWWNEWA